MLQWNRLKPAFAPDYSDVGKISHCSNQRHSLNNNSGFIHMLTTINTLEMCAVAFILQHYVDWVILCSFTYPESEISGSHGGEYEDGCLLGCCTLMMEAASTSETSVNIYHTTRRTIPEDSQYLFPKVLVNSG
jgi:hypothetical protein